MQNHLIIKTIDIIILSFLFIFLSLKAFTKFGLYLSDYNLFLEKKFDSRDEAFNKAKNFIKNCLTEDFYKFKSSSYNKYDIKISVVIPMYNCEKYILRAIKSVQLQNISNFEILLIDDNSTDNTLSVTEEMRNEDMRIRIIKNKNNMGILYSRSIGILSSKGKYIFTLDNDDIFLDNDVFDSMTQIAEKGKFDIVEFRAISNRNLEKDIINTKITDAKFRLSQPIILFQPTLGRFPIPTGNETGKYELHDIFLWGKCIKTIIYQKALNKLGHQRYSRFMLRYEDILANYMIFNTAESFIFVEKYGIYHIIRQGSAVSIGRKLVSRRTNILYLLDVVIDFSQNHSENKKLGAYLLIYFLRLRRIQRILDSNEYKMNLIISCINRVLKSKYISETYKNEIRNITKQLKYINFSKIG